MERGNLIVAIFGGIFLLSIVMIFSQGFRFTGYATETSTTSNVTIATYFAIEMSTNLTEGIQFGTISTLPATDENATHNYDGLNTTGNGSGTSFWVNISEDSNSALDFCIRATALNTSGGDEIGLANETYYNNTDTNLTLPDLANEVAITTSYAKAGDDVSVGGTNYYRFWLDVPAGTATGVYNNTVEFKGVTSAASC